LEKTLKKEKLDPVIEEAYKRLRSATSLGCDHIPDRFGSYASYYVKWDKKKAVAIIKELLSE
jgi:RNA binding exosome subunit